MAKWNMQVYSNLARRQIHKVATGVLGSEDPKERMLSGETVETTGHFWGNAENPGRTT